MRLFNKSCLLALLALVSLNTGDASLMAWECYDAPQCCPPTDCNRMYVGGFGGGIYSNSTRVSQMGTAFFTEAEGGPLAVDARGNVNAKWSGFGGVQIGYEWVKCPQDCGCSSWSISTAAEIEGYWYSHTRKGHLFNTTDTERLPEHDFVDSFHMDTGVYLANAVFSLNFFNFKALSPYVGVGVGATRISISKATSTQVEPPEPGINHFNSLQSDSSWAFAAQAKAGLRYNFGKSFHVFGEYRYLFVDSSNYILGSTVYPTHAHTSPWNIKVHNIQHNAFVFGIQYDL